MCVLNSISEGLKLTISFKRLVPFLIINLILFYSLIIFVKQIIGLISLSSNPFAMMSSLGIYMILFIVIALVNILITGAITHQVKYPKKSLMASLKYTMSKYVTMLFSVLIAGIIAVILSLPQYIGWLFTILWSLIVFYLYPSIIIGGKGVITSLKDTWNVFKKFPLETFATGLLVGIIGLIIISIFTVPIIFYFIGSILGSIRIDESSYMNNTLARNLVETEILPKLMNAINSPTFVVYFFIFCLGVSIQKTFDVCTRAKLYMNLKKGKTSSEEE